ncbi:MAG: penicillin-binding transpeptidase domain-containing protein, partial [Candidatus Rokuibacteriota bacterium]
VQELTLAEIALVAGLPRAPSSYSPFDHPEVAKRRRSLVLARMVEQGYTDATEAKRATEAPLGLVPAERRRTSGQYFLGYLEKSLEAKFGSDLLYKGGLSVYTTLSSGMQRAAEEALREGLGAVAARHPAPPNGPAPPQGAVIVIEPQTGYLKALVGGADYARSEFNRAVHARRQPGSAFKPFVYIAALEAGWSPADLLDDSPVRYLAGPGRAWEPENYDGKFRGPITVQHALEQSVNIPTIKLLEEVGVDRTIKLAKRFGIQSPLQANLTLALGSSDVTLLELTAAYAALANHGVWMEPIAVRHVTDGQGRLIEENIPQGRDAVTPAIAHAITQMMRGAVERGTAVQARVLGRPIAGKTGTTNDFSNAWFVGYTPSIAAGVWVGHDRVRSLGRDETGARAALPIWIALMRAALKDRPVEEFTPPDGTTAARDVPPATGIPAVSTPPAAPPAPGVPSVPLPPSPPAGAFPSTVSPPPSPASSPPPAPPSLPATAVTPTPVPPSAPLVLPRGLEGPSTSRPGFVTTPPSER